MKNKSIIIPTIGISIIIDCLLLSAFWGCLTFPFFVLAIGVPLVLIILASYSNWYRNRIRNLTDTRKRLPELIKERKKSLARLILTVSVAVTIAYMANLLIEQSGHPSNMISFNIILAVELMIAVAIHYFRSINHNLHKIVFCLIMIGGCFYAFTAPTEALLGYDETTHFKAITNAEEYITGQENLASNEICMNMDKHSADIFSQQGRINQDELYNTLGKEKKATEGTASPGLRTFVDYSVELTGYLFGKALHLPYALVFRVEKLVNILFYALLVSSAIRRTKYYKAVFTVISTGSLILFEAFSFQYDPFLLAMTLFGYALYVQSCEEKHMSSERMLGIVLFTMTGCIVKAVYFPIMIPMLFAPKDVFESEKQQKTFRILLIAAMALLLWSFLAPVLFGNLGTGDARGGDDVNSTEQVKFILGHPLSYAIIYLRHLVTSFLNPLYGFGYLTAIGSIGFTTTSILPFLVMIGATNFCGSDLFSGRKYRIISLISWLMTVTLCVTALYVSFTPVRSSTINGVQMRYHLPMMILLFLLFGKKHNRLYKYSGIYATVFTLVMCLSLVLFTGQYFYVMF